MVVASDLSRTCFSLLIRLVITCTVLGVFGARQRRSTRSSSSPEVEVTLVHSKQIFEHLRVGPANASRTVVQPGATSTSACITIHDIVVLVMMSDAIVPERFRADDGWIMIKTHNKQELTVNFLAKTTLLPKT